MGLRLTPEQAAPLVARALERRRKTKYGNRQTAGYASAAEAKRARDLRLLLAAGEISDLREQVRYELIPKQDGERAVTYTADFVYRDRGGNLIVEDVKGWAARDWPLRRKLMLWRHGIRVLETKLETKEAKGMMSSRRLP